MIAAPTRRTLWTCAALLAAATVAGGAGCVTLSTRRLNPALDQPSAERHTAKQPAPDRPVSIAAGESRSSRVQAELVPLGTVPFDNLSLPIASPDGRFIATQTGISPTWPTMLAQHGASVPEATLVQVYKIQPPMQAKPDEPIRTSEPELMSTVIEPVLLGRSCDAQGFLVESPRPDGSRWIGQAAWDTGQIRWLISDGFVNAFASLGPDGKLAWSRRAVDGEHFELVIRNHDHEWTISPQDGDWLMPVWSGAGDGLFAMHLLSGRLNAVYMVAQSDAALRQSRRTLFLASGADDFVAYQALAGQVMSIGASDAASQDQLLFLHPVQLRMALWRPMLRNGGLPILLANSTLAGVVDQSNWAIVATDRQLFRQYTLDTRVIDELMVGTVIPRSVHGPFGEYVLLGIGPQTPGLIGLTGMRLAPLPASASADERGQ